MRKASDLSYASEFRCRFRKAIISIVEMLSGRGKLFRLYRRHVHGVPYTGEADFWRNIMRGLSVGLNVDAYQLERIPREGPLVVVANHPFGVLDGIIISYLISQVRRDYKVMTTSVLNVAPQVEPFLIPVHFDEKGLPLKSNFEARKKAMDTLLAGGCVVVFPAGGVSTTKSPFGRRAVDSDWQPFIGKMIQRSGANVVPIFFHGQNSRLFQIASHISVTLRHSLFLKELVRRIGSRVDVIIDAPIPYEELAHMKDRGELSSYLRARTYAAGNPDSFSAATASSY